MMRLLRDPGRAILFGLAVLFVLLDCPPARAQAERPCIRVDYVGVEQGKPFSAEHVASSVPIRGEEADKGRPLVELVARDGAGRVRIERRPPVRTPRDSEQVELTSADGRRFTATREAISTSVIITECKQGKSIILQPGMKIARTRDEFPAVSAGTALRNYSSYFNHQGAILTPNLEFEDLGAKEIQGIQTVGFRTTHVGTAEDGEWNGKPTWVQEEWVSDDLAATLVAIRRDFVGNKVMTRELKDIKRDEPDAALFEIPSDYIVDPTMEQMPRITLQAKPVAKP